MAKKIKKNQKLIILKNSFKKSCTKKVKTPLKTIKNVL